MCYIEIYKISKLITFQLNSESLQLRNEHIHLPPLQLQRIQTRTNPGLNHGLKTNNLLVVIIIGLITISIDKRQAILVMSRQQHM